MSAEKKQAAADRKPASPPAKDAKKPGLKVRSHVKAGPIGFNHSETLVKVEKPKPGLRVKSNVKAGPTASPIFDDGGTGGGGSNNHSETLVRLQRSRR